MELRMAGYKGKRKWYVSYDGRDPVEVIAPDSANAMVRAAIYYRLDWLKVEDRLRLKVWPA